MEATTTSLQDCASGCPVMPSGKLLRGKSKQECKTMNGHAIPCRSVCRVYCTVLPQQNVFAPPTQIKSIKSNQIKSNQYQQKQQTATAIKAAEAIPAEAADSNNNSSQSK